MSRRLLDGVHAPSKERVVWSDPGREGEEGPTPRRGGREVGRAGEEEGRMEGQRG